MASEQPQSSPPQQSHVVYPPPPYGYPPPGAVPYPPPPFFAAPPPPGPDGHPNGPATYVIGLPPLPPGFMYMPYPAPMPPTTGEPQPAPASPPAPTTATYTPTQGAQTDPNRPKRKQVKQACTNCASACKRCDDSRPCQRCVKYGMPELCKDGIRKERQRGIKRGPYKRKNKVPPPDVPQPLTANEKGEWQPPLAVAPSMPPPEGYYPFLYTGPPSWAAPAPGQEQAQQTPVPVPPGGPPLVPVTMPGDASASAGPSHSPPLHAAPPFYMPMPMPGMPMPYPMQPYPPFAPGYPMPPHIPYAQPMSPPKDGSLSGGGSPAKSSIGKQSDVKNDGKSADEDEDAEGDNDTDNEEKRVEAGLMAA
ncbi:hypothetical protein PUNSTDRAFT_143952 [Punctularia strigosozonata HHB-11173 SS5]|uniref:uncharacterized protein n=1 Tax=Punctularia strigosozonata (strain HHB-11173) TaxID=741275 RepID=UPI0004417125|nr:uncharacterized protein PUNSTDRAFT_143952 [Punctularia strigosozonata HHB-11173 SS5]EIN08322.1 hypothetical protein PUNSTDRAFT_143952 [Punctularia strigosozonata HHB-11173 SS5]